jgi:hypothetical protein
LFLEIFETKIGSLVICLLVYNQVLSCREMFSTFIRELRFPRMGCWCPLEEERARWKKKKVEGSRWKPGECLG